ncbi:MAG TPA: rod shape-determining protein RodA [Anaeromyxobacteraceae bacterium]|nr:rod shape-determining protein RodA [Anaeromyxobacteraceae bacterium]
MALELSFTASPERRTFAHFPGHVAWFVVSICAIGVWNLASASRNTGAPGATPIWKLQLLFMAAFALLSLALTLLDYRNYQRIAWVFYVLVILLLVFVALKGKRVMGARRWIALGPFSLQPSELAKLSVTLALARWLHDDAERRKEPYGLLGLALPLAIILVPAAMVKFQPDLGTALIVAGTGFTMLLFAPVRWRTIAILGAVAVVGATAAYPHLKPYQKKRIETFVNPEGDVRGAGYHATQSMIAVGSGEGTGKGWGQGTQNNMRFLPEQHTDFVFSVWAEEHGFLGCAVLLTLYLALVASAISIAASARDRFGHYAAIGVAGMLFWQAFINVGMVIGLLPVVGVTLPLMSYGGSSVMTIMIAIGLLANIAMRRFVN